jgi:cob(I)alamin adenosyltransferase
MLRKGLVQVYTGDHDHFNFAPLGLGLRASGHKLRTLITCLLPHEFMDGAPMASTLLSPYLVIEHTKIQKVPPDRQWSAEEKEEVREAFQRTKEVLIRGQFDLVVLNGINQVWNQGIIPSEDVLALIDKKPRHVELILTGPRASETLIERADLVTDMVYFPKKGHPQKDQDHPDIAPTEVITGNGKGKTTYCLGKAMLMSCLGIRSVILQFIKSPRAYGEVRALKKLPYLEIKTMGEGFLGMDSPILEKRHLDAARRTWEECLREIFSLKYGLVVLDEINIATYYGLIHADRVREMLFLKPQELHLILSGRNAHLEVGEGASAVIEMREIKHPFNRGIKARKGIEF